MQAAEQQKWRTHASWLQCQQHARKRLALLQASSPRACQSTSAVVTICVRQGQSFSHMHSLCVYIRQPPRKKYAALKEVKQKHAQFALRRESGETTQALMIAQKRTPFNTFKTCAFLKRLGTAARESLRHANMTRPAQAICVPRLRQRLSLFAHAVVREHSLTSAKNTCTQKARAHPCIRSEPSAQGHHIRTRWHTKKYTRTHYACNVQFCVRCRF